MSLKWRDALLPDDFTRGIEGRRIDRLIIEEIHVQQFAIPGRSRRRLGRIAVPLVDEFAAVHDGLPHRLSCRPVEANHQLFLRGGIGRGDIDAVSRHGGRTVPAAPQWSLPEDMLGFTPLDRYRL